MRSSARRRLERAFWLALASGLALCVGCAQPQASPEPVNQCATCHGAPSRTGTPLEQAAPPGDLSGNTDPSTPGVGAHQSHLVASRTHAAVACTECHVVPEQIDSPGHAEGTGPAKVTPGPLAKTGGRNPTYDSVSFTCASTYCHLDSEPKWTEPMSSEDNCESCHGAPPPAPHPQSEDCGHCHGKVVASEDLFRAPELHVNGTVDLPADDDCGGCHGSQTSNAPPTDLTGSVSTSSIGVGAHQAHLTGGDYSRPVACRACHIVPKKLRSKGHLDDTPNAEVTFSGLALEDSRHPVWDRSTRTCSHSYCHGPVSPSSAPSPDWTSDPGGPLPCDSCHGLPPASPHPPSDNCSVCHKDVVSGPPGNWVIVAPNLHIDGKVEVF
jgi:predicted CxxxxCH...CXXCH cytochrome family protein